MKESSDSAPPRSCKKRKRISLLADCTVMRRRRPLMSVRLAMSEIRAKWTAKVPDRLVAADGLIAGDSEEDDEEEDTEDDGYSE